MRKGVHALRRIDDRADDRPTRQSVEDRLTDDILGKLHDLSGNETDRQRFWERLGTILFRYERDRIASDTTPRNERKSQLGRIEKAAMRFLGALDAANEDVCASLDSHTDRFRDALWDAWTFESGEPFPSEEPKAKQAHHAVSRVLEATRAELDYLAESKGETRRVQQAALKQLIEDLAGCFRFGTDTEPRSGCYYDGAQSAYRGPFYVFVKTVLDWYDPRGYFSDQALGKLIQRTLDEG